MDSLLAVCPFDSAQCVPGDFDFRPHMVDKKESKKDGSDAPAASQGHECKAPKRLPHRLKMSVFSKSVGHRPTGLQVAQVKLFVERFPTEFREMSMQKIVLPCDLHGQLPFVALGGGLPCPCLSTMNALRFLESRAESVANWEP